jgi:ABC-type nitrate/sulfonate/bicarbonate transport system permease component
MRQERIIGGVGILFVVVLWEMMAFLNAGSFVVAGPLAIVDYIATHTGLMFRAAIATLSAAAWGFFCGNVAAIIMAVFTLLVPQSARIIAAFALITFCLPLVATGPILRVLFGPGTGPQITLAGLAVFYTTFLALRVGLQAIPQSWSDLNKIYGRGALSELIHVRAMASVPYLIAGLQIAAPAAFLGAMIGEFTGAERGMGVLTLRAMRGLDVEATWALATVSAAIAMVTYWGIGWVGRGFGYEPALLLRPPTNGPKKPVISRCVSGFIIAVMVLGVWQLSMDIFDLNRFFAKRPGDVWTYLMTSLEARQTLCSAVKQTMITTIPGYISGLLFGATLAICLTLVPLLGTVFLPVAVALRAVPIITTAPLIVLALGRGPLGTMTIVAVMIFFPTLVACLQGLRQTPGQIMDVFDSYAAGRVRLLMWARVPTMLPAFFAAARAAVPAAVLAVTTAEWLAIGKGVGNLMALTATTSNYNMLWAATAALSLIAVAGYGIVAAVERAVLRVYASEQVQS